ncbi:glycosyltransferase family 1 protein [bacterium]|nr:glycosyltransferase family 1 protein [bacterium]
MRRALAAPGSSEIVGRVSADEVAQVQRAADVLVHVEGLDLRSRMQVHQSFSTKIVDYLACARCVLAIGPRGVASIDYFVENDSALVASSELEVRRALDSLLADPRLVSAYADKAWESGRRNHQKGVLQQKLIAELDVLVRDYGRLK